MFILYMLLPLELYYKILTFGAVVPPHFTAYSNSTIRPIFSCELHSNMSDGIMILEENDEELTTDEEYYLFLLHND